MKYKNNPLNIRATSSNWLGLVGRKRGFCEFSSVVFGIRTGLYLLLRTYKKCGWLSLEDIIYHWAPPSDGNDTCHYLWFVTSRSGISAGQNFCSLSLSLQYDVVKCMCIMETGYYLSYEDFILAKNLL